MIGLRLTFPWGRYYAHPWGLNPARLREAEWPPSPWRLLRALAAGWFRAHRGQPTGQDLLDLLKVLGSELPDIQIGRVTFSKTIHWQPNFGETNTGKKEERESRLAHGVYKKTRHENHFAATGDPVVFRYELAGLPPDRVVLMRDTLSDILPHVSYFGRAESLSYLELFPEDAAMPAEGWCRACMASGQPTRRIAEDCRDLFCPDPATFQPQFLWQRKGALVGPADAPPHLIEDLLAHQPLPDGARWVSYQMPDGWPGKWIVRTAQRLNPRRRPAHRVARHLRFSLECRIPVLLKFTVPLAEQFRRRALFNYGKARESFALHGPYREVAAPEDVRGDHQHAFYLPLGADAAHPELLNELHVWSEYGFTREEVEALMRVGSLHWGGGGGRYPIRPVLLEVSSSWPAHGPLAAWKKPARVWQSRTPFVPPRYFYRGNLHGAKLMKNDSPENQLAQCLHKAHVLASGEIRRLTPNLVPQQSLPPQAAWDIVRAPGEEDDSAQNGIAVVAHLPPHSSAPTEKDRRIGFLFQIRFDSPVSMPYPAFGHSAHFGLGLFVPAAPSAHDQLPISSL
jgi:CRISPR-associated protein Csb2